jgi:DNA invertase Pin-like site-specific DNA recombinase
MRVVFYARVSTDHEKQVSALDNQIDWYKDYIAQHKDWSLEDYYIDEGITGTSDNKRKEFLRMMNDGIEHHKFDMIITREVSRFARNTVDALQWSRRLLEKGIRIFFVNDNIDTGVEDGELRLTLMATLAQDESRKISERVKAGLKVARNKGIILGCGNILGYDRTLDGRFVINPEQASTVKMIYKWYLEGNGVKKIRNLLEKEGRKTATGKDTWDVSAVSRVLSNPMYIGYQNQQQSVSENYLTQKRVQQDKKDYILIKGKHEPIITQEVFDKVQLTKEQRLTWDVNEKRTGKRESKDIWPKKLLCICGSKYKSYHWRADTFGYSCYNQTINGKKSSREKKGLPAENACDLPSICDWKLDMMMWKVVKRTWTTGPEDIKRAFQIIKECYQGEKDDTLEQIKDLRERLAKWERKKDNLIEMRADGEITKEDFIEKRDQYIKEIEAITRRLDEVESRERHPEDLDSKVDKIKEQLNRMIDFSTGIIDHDVLDEILTRIVHIGDYEYDVYLNLGVEPGNAALRLLEEEKVIKVKQFNVKGFEILRERHLKLFDMEITFDEAEAYRKMLGKYLRRSQWNDMKVHVYL